MEDLKSELEREEDGKPYVEMHLYNLGFCRVYLTLNRIVYYTEPYTPNARRGTGRVAIDDYLSQLNNSIADLTDALEEGGAITPTVGMGAALLLHSDVHPYAVISVIHTCTVISVSECGKRAQIQTDKAIRIKTGGGSPEWLTEPDPEGAIHHIQREGVVWRTQDGVLVQLGTRESYHDPNF